jgi:hypothetical protein
VYERLAAEVGGYGKLTLGVNTGELSPPAAPAFRPLSSYLQHAAAPVSYGKACMAFQLGSPVSIAVVVLSAAIRALPTPSSPHLISSCDVLPCLPASHLFPSPHPCPPPGCF